MTLQEFITKYKGQKIDWDKAYDGQCVDLFRQYNHEVLEINQPKGVVGAADFWAAYDTDSVLNTNFDKIPNSETFIPIEGDVAIWNKKMGGGFGHISVCTGKGDLNTFESFDQNWSKISYCELVTHTYSSFYGVFRPKKTIETPYAQLQSDLAEQQKQVSNLQTQVNGLLENIKAWETKYNECNTQRIEATSSSDGFRRQLNDFVAQLATKLGTRQETAEILASVDTCLTFEDANIELQKRLAKEEADHQAAISSLESKIASLETQLASLKLDLKAVKDTQITPSNLTSDWSIISIIKRIFGIK